MSSAIASSPSHDLKYKPSRFVMVTPNPYVHEPKPSSVGSQHVSEVLSHELSGLDLAMRLHYIKGIYFFGKEQVEGLTIHELKRASFPWLDQYSTICGRIRSRADEPRPRDDQHEPDAAHVKLMINNGGTAGTIFTSSSTNNKPYFIKTNDAGVRVIEARCDKTIEEWLEMEELATMDEGLVPSVPIGMPKVNMSPLVLLQYTSFACGGMSIGYSWNHALGDAFISNTFMNMYGKFIDGNSPTLRPPPLQMKPEKDAPGVAYFKTAHHILKPAKSIEDKWWINTGDKEMKSFRLLLKSPYLELLKSKVGKQFTSFEMISAFLWKTISYVRGGGGGGGGGGVNYKTNKRVTVVRKYEGMDSARWFLGNRHQIAYSVEFDSNVSEADLGELARVIGEERGGDSRKEVEEWMEREGYPEVMMYGGDLTFINLDSLKCYELEINQQSPLFAEVFYSSVGAEGVVTVLPGRKHDMSERVVNVCLPKEEMESVRQALKKSMLCMR